MPDYGAAFVLIAAGPIDCSLIDPLRWRDRANRSCNRRRWLVVIPLIRVGDFWPLGRPHSR